MSGSQHHYQCTVTWTGNTGSGTSTYRSYERAHQIGSGDKPAIPGSSDPAFRGDPQRWNPEELLLASLSSCHMLFFLHFASTAGVVVLDYVDTPTGTMVEEGSGGHFTEVTLHPQVTVARTEMIAACHDLHHQAHAACYIASSVNFPVRHRPSTTASQPAPTT
jgi:organic hydroperoxide reductase OsmC/OhrA